MNRSRIQPDALQAPVTHLRGVGAALAEKLERLHVRRVQDLLFLLPLRYEDRTRITPIGALRIGQHAMVEGEIQLVDVVRGRRRSLCCRIQDGTGMTTLRLFHFTARQRALLEPGKRLRCFGEARQGATGLELYHPEYRLISDPAPPLPERLTPVYPLVDGVGQTRMRSLCQAALACLEQAPEALEPDLGEAVRFLHQPPAATHPGDLEAGTHPLQQRLALDELLAHHLSLLQARARIQTEQAPPLARPDTLLQEFLSGLPFAPTDAQQRAIDEIAADLARPVPMQRLLQGDVGSGKTLVAAAATLSAAAHGRQTALMAPTELLAEQHARTLEPWLAPLGIRVALLTGRQGARARRQQLEATTSGQAALVIGTHALFQQDVDFHQLALVIIDEQHRFGVHQRLALRRKGQLPHQLVMTATPIPRTLAMSAYADLDLSVLDTLPPGRTPVQTVALNGDRRGEVVERISHACREGRQAYWVCTLIEESDSLQAQAAEATALQLQQALPDLRVGLVHGRLKGADKAAVMAGFEQGEIDLLVATTVIEVGVNVPNASLMVIENAERLGLAQLHQLRGRVGRGSTASHCVLLYQPPLSRAGRARLNVMRETTDGFVIAERDLEIRGPGELLGTRQTGAVGLRVADLMRDRELLPEVRRRAEQLQTQDPAAVACIIDRWLGGREEYAYA